jgi:hypothetical protein
MSRMFVSVLTPLPDYETATSHLSTPRAYMSEPKVEGPSDISPEVLNSRFGQVMSPRKSPYKQHTNNALDDTPIHVPFSPSSEAYNRAWRLADLPLPPSLAPSMAHSTYTSGVISCPDAPGEQPVMEWDKRMRVAGLGQVDCNVYSAYVSEPHERYLQADLSVRLWIRAGPQSII